MEYFDIHAFALAGTVTFTTAYLIYSIAAAFFIGMFLRSYGSILHLTNAKKYANAVEVTLASFLIGLVQVIFHSFIFSWIFAYAYNYFAM